jgi:hypothetical protein
LDKVISTSHKLKTQIVICALAQRENQFNTVELVKRVAVGVLLYPRGYY